MGRLADQKIMDAVSDLESAAESLLGYDSERAKTLGMILKHQTTLIEGLVPMIREEIYEDEDLY